MNAPTNLAVVEPPVSNAGSLLTAISRASADPAVDIDKVQKLFQMHKELVAIEAEAAFNGAMARAQSKITPVANNARNDQTSSGYAKLAAINTAITPIYTAEGLSISFNSADCPVAGCQRTIAIVSHERGHTRTYHFDLPIDDVGIKGNANKTKVHATGSTTSYARRYLVCMIFNVTTEDDDDGNAAGKKRQEVEPDSAGQKALEACGSDDSLKKAWAALTQEQRKTLGDVMAACKKRLREAD